MNLTADNAGETLELLRENRDKLGDGRDMGRQMGLFFRAWAKLDGEAATEAALTLSEGERDRGRGGRGGGGFTAAAALSTWVQQDPNAAQAWLNGREDGREKTMLTFGLMNGLAGSDPDAATEFLLNMQESNAIAAAADADGEGEGSEWAARATEMMSRRYYDMIASAQIERGIDSAEQWASNLPEGDFRNTAFAEIAQHYARTDLEQAREFAANHAGEAYASAAVREVAEAIAEENPQEAVDWDLQTLSVRIA